MFDWTTPLYHSLFFITDDEFLVYENPSDGSSKKKQAEQQAAKVALQHLSGLFNCVFEAEAGKNYKGLLKERMDALHLQSPVYRYKVKGGVSEAVEGPGTSGDNLHCEFNFIHLISVPLQSGCESKIFGFII